MLVKLINILKIFKNSPSNLLPSLKSPFIQDLSVEGFKGRPLNLNPEALHNKGLV